MEEEKDIYKDMQHDAEDNADLMKSFKEIIKKNKDQNTAFRKLLQELAKKTNNSNEKKSNQY